MWFLGAVDESSPGEGFTAISFGDDKNIWEQTNGNGCTIFEYSKKH